MFAKLYETEIGQILIKIEANEDDKPEVRYYFEPVGLGVCNMAVSFDTWDSADALFEKIDDKAAVALVSKILNEYKL